MQEIVSLFAEPEDRDELGMGQLRDTFSEALFPGTSTLHTRARYLLFVPWCYLDAAARGGTAAEGQRRAAENERALAASLLAGPAAHAGEALTTATHAPPSAVYWGALRRYGILRVAEPSDALGRPQLHEPGQDELAERSFSAWAPTLPSVPPGFPGHLGTGFELTPAEAGWLQERILASTEGSLLHHLVSDGQRPRPEGDAAWDDPACYASPPKVRALLEHARLFSLAEHGASLLYNLLVAERYRASGYFRVANPVDLYRDRLDGWAAECRLYATPLSGWDRRAFWQTVLAANPQVRAATRRFLDYWLDWLCRLELDGAADDRAMRGLIASRERAHKGAQSRLVNGQLLASWSGRAGTGRMTYRWEQARRLALDLHDGLEAADAGA